MNKKEIVLLGKKTFGWKVNLFFTAPFWFLSTSPTKKTWEEFKYGLIKHKCEWDRNVIQSDQYATWNPCKHHGCNFVWVIKYS